MYGFPLVSRPRYSDRKLREEGLVENINGLSQRWNFRVTVAACPGYRRNRSNFRHQPRRCDMGRGLARRYPRKSRSLASRTQFLRLLSGSLKIVSKRDWLFCPCATRRSIAFPAFSRSPLSGFSGLLRCQRFVTFRVQTGPALSAFCVRWFLPASLRFMKLIFGRAREYHFGDSECH